MEKAEFLAKIKQENYDEGASYISRKYIKETSHIVGAAILILAATNLICGNGQNNYALYAALFLMHTYTQFSLYKGYQNKVSLWAGIFFCATCLYFTAQHMLYLMNGIGV